jgi:hypothetical protein
VKDFNVVGQKTARNGPKWPFMCHEFSILKFSKLQKTGNCVAFDPNKI